MAKVVLNVTQPSVPLSVPPLPSSSGTAFIQQGLSRMTKDPKLLHSFLTIFPPTYLLKASFIKSRLTLTLFSMCICIGNPIYKTVYSAPGLSDLYRALWKTGQKRSLFSHPVSIVGHCSGQSGGRLPTHLPLKG